MIDFEYASLESLLNLLLHVWRQLIGQILRRACDGVKSDLGIHVLVPARRRPSQRLAIQG